MPNLLYIKFRNTVVYETVSVGKDEACNVDLDQDGNVVGVELISTEGFDVSIDGHSEYNT